MNARTTNPATSQDAAQQHESSGKAASHRETILSYVRTFPGKTSAEIAFAVRMERHEAARRLPELREVGLVVNGEARKCTVSGTQQMTWLPAVRRNTPAPATKQQTLW